MKTASLFMLVALVAFLLSLLSPWFLSKSVSYAFENESLGNDHFRGEMRKGNASLPCHACLIPVDDQEQLVRMDWDFSGYNSNDTDDSNDDTDQPQNVSAGHPPTFEEWKKNQARKKQSSNTNAQGSDFYATPQGRTVIFMNKLRSGVPMTDSEVQWYMNDMQQEMYRGYQNNQGR
ncbi:MAG: hypothetical protein J6P29_07225 [Acetobacter sp.]|nr:hypothetical protein [Acetobacter sp.]